MNGHDCILLSAIVDSYSKIKQLVGKPKMFFFLDDGTKKDSAPSNQILVRIIQTLSFNKALLYYLDSTIFNLLMHMQEFASLLA
jgi:hypothetical protein